MMTYIVMAFAGAAIYAGAQPPSKPESQLVRETREWFERRDRRGYR